MCFLGTAANDMLTTRRPRPTQSTGSLPAVVVFEHGLSIVWAYPQPPTGQAHRPKSAVSDVAFNGSPTELPSFGHFGDG
jgi:hypothetical protein